VFARPTSTHGWWGWVTTVDHKRIGILYGATAFLFFLVGGIMALLMRTQLAVGNNDFLSAKLYNQIMTLHGTTMIFLWIIPVFSGFGKFSVSDRSAREGRNPATGEKIHIAATRVPKFTAGAGLKKAVK